MQFERVVVDYKNSKEQMVFASLRFEHRNDERCCGSND
jgi:hypothetical protein